MNCHMPEALAEDTAWGLKALSTKGNKASSVGILRRSSSSTMKYRYLLERWVARLKYSGLAANHCWRSVTNSDSKAGMAKPRRMRSHKSAGKLKWVTWGLTKSV